MPSEPSGASWVAIYAAAVATFTFAWNVYRGITERARLSVSAKVVGEFGDRPDYPGAIELTVTNEGRAPTTVTALWIGWRKPGERQPFEFHRIDEGGDILPKPLTPGTLLSVRGRRQDFEELFWKRSRFHYFAAVDSSGRMYKTAWRTGKVVRKTLEGLRIACIRDHVHDYFLHRKPVESLLDCIRRIDLPWTQVEPILKDLHDNHYRATKLGGYEVAWEPVKQSLHIKW